jgi:hypothetical protein
VSVTREELKDPKVVPAGSVRVMALSAALSRPPVDVVVKSVVQLVSALAAVEIKASDTPVTDRSSVIEPANEAAASEDVDTATLLDPTVVGLVSTFNVTLTVSPGFTVCPRKMGQLTVVPLTKLQ